MNSFSDKEYENLKKDTAEIRQCITRYIGYIVSITGFSGVLKIFFDGTSPKNTLLVLSLSLIITTLLFEIIWYKFKSHNRTVGYAQLLIQEMDAIPLQSKKDNFKMKKKSLEKKEYILNYKKYLDKKLDKGVKDLYSWEFVISRLYNSYFSSKKNGDLSMALLKSISKTRFVFMTSQRLYPFIEINDHDVQFFEKIIFPLYLSDKPKNYLRNFFNYFHFLIYTDSKKVLNRLPIDNRYLSNGWRYPKKITQIGFTTAIFTYTYFVYTFLKVYEWAAFTNLDFQYILPSLFFITTTVFFLYWIYKYVFHLKDIIYGRHSIDAYCWQFFIFRTQLLNEKGLIPVIFSRSFIRYFKTDLYANYYEKNEEVFKKVKPNNVTLESFDSYFNKLRNFKTFNGEEQKIHDLVVAAFKEEEPFLRKAATKEKKERLKETKG